MGADDADATGLGMDQLDAYAKAASEVLFELSGRQFRGARDRTVEAAVGRAFRGRAKASLGSWWPVSAVSEVVGVPVRGSATTLADADWSWSGGIGLEVPGAYAGGRVQCLLTTGQDATEFGRAAAAVLAAELAFADPEYDGDEETRLPALVTSVSRQGVSQSFATTLDVVKEGATGINEVDQFVRSYNKIKATSRPTVRKMRR